MFFVFRFDRPPSLNNYGNKNGRNIFSSFRLSKRFNRRKEEAKNDDNECNASDETLDKDCMEESNLTKGQKHKHYFSSVSSFFSNVAYKVNGNSGETKIERSQTIPETGFLTDKNEFIDYKDKVPGLIGIQNHGNTCFINAIIQCLSHIDILAEYFVLDQYKNDLAKCNRINSKKYGTRGEITETLSVLLKSIWTLKYVSDYSLNLKSSIEKFESGYRGSNQHDAAEFLMFILDKVHEDLNTASKKKYKKIKVCEMCHY